VAFGSAFATLGSPVTVGRVERIEALDSYRDSGRDNLTVCSSEVVSGVQHGALTLLASGPDRVPIAPLALTEFSSKGLVEDAGSFAVVSGHFGDSGEMGLLALAFFQRRDTPPPINVWSVPAITEPGPTPVRWPGALDARLKPLVFRSDDGTFEAAIASTSADLDADGRDEAIFAMPADDGGHCGLLVLRTDARGSVGNAAQTPVIVDEPCPQPQIMTVKFHEDEPGEQKRPPDLALLTGSSDAADRHLYVLWNDGNGQFVGENKALVSAQGEAPRAFTVLPLDHGSAGFAYVTQTELRLVRAPIGHEFPPPDSVPPGIDVSNGTGIVAADVNGDHLSDLVYSQSGTLHVLKAGLEGQ